MQARLGIYDKYSSSADLDPSINGIKNQQTRLNYQGGSLQQDRMIADKRRSLERALWYSYQGANVRKITSTSEETVRALINPNKLKQDYDDKIISIKYEHNFKSGDVFEWVGTNTFWLIYLQDLTELAYFRGDIRRCSHEISWEDEDGIHKTYAAIRGPVETKINYIQKHEISIDTPNYSLSILIPKTDSAEKYFKRYTKFYLTGNTDICWRVEAVDTLSTPGIIKVEATEYYINETLDDVENGVVGGLIVEPVSPNTKWAEEIIVGETFIKPKMQYEYTYKGNLEGKWTTDKDYPIELIQDGKSVKLRWLKTYSGQFDLIYGGSYKKTIVVESLF